MGFRLYPYLAVILEYVSATRQLALAGIRISLPIVPASRVIAPPRTLTRPNWGL